MDQLLKLSELLRHIPTGDNAQPFRYAIHHDFIEVFHHKEIAKHVYNQSNVASLLSLGMIVFVIKTFAASQRLKVSMKFTERFLDEESWLTCHFSPSTEEVDTSDIHLLNFLELRKTDRGMYQGEDFDLSALKQTFKDQIYFKTDLTKNAFKMIKKFEGMMFDDINVFKDIEKWIRYTQKDVVKTRTGMSRQNLGLDYANALLFKIFRRNTFLNSVLKKYFKFVSSLKMGVVYRRSAGFGLCVLKDNSDPAIVEMGSNILKIWLMLTQKGYNLQPISAPSLTSFINRNRNGQFIPSYAKDTSKCCDTLNREFSSQGEIIWLFRFGRPVNTKMKTTLRLKPGDVILGLEQLI
jgi:hypothetical protein